MITRIRTAVVAAVLATALLLSGGLFAQQFGKDQVDKDQREEMGEIIRDYLLENPEILREVIQALEAKEQEAGAAALTDTIRERGQELYRGEHDLVAGNPDGSVTMVEFFDYNCGYCKRAMSDVLALIESDDDLRVVFKEWPILGEGSRFAARAALASAKQGKYWDFHLALMETRSVDETTTLEVAERIGLDVEQLKADMEAPEVAAVIEGNMRLASAFGIQGTPVFFIDDQVIPGAVGHEALAQVISEVREAGGCTIC
ncbi:MAG TPA: DsbA family protein [Aestuariivirgaceae bacterium]|nr:DsbA family protein [Aestuariivirgaceae bacterium]